MGVALLMTAIGCGESTPPAPPLAAPAAAPAIAPTGLGTVAFTVAAGLPEWNSSYVAGHLADGDTNTAWYTPSSHTLPLPITLNQVAPALLVAVDFDNNLGSYRTSGARAVTVEALSQTGQIMATVPALLHAGGLTTVPFPAPVMAAGVRVTVRSNHGGTYTGLAGIALRTTPGSGQAPAQAVARGLAFTPSGLPEWNSGYALTHVADGSVGSTWFTPMNPTYPLVGMLTLPAVGTITSITFDTNLGSYATSAVRELTTEFLGASGQVLSSIPVALPQSARTTVPLPSPVQASSVRLTIRSNHGGSYAGLAEIVIDGSGTQF